MSIKLYKLNLVLPLALWSAAFSISNISYGQGGPELPCVNCPVPETSIRSVKPEAGIWRNPEQSGTGFMFEVQNDRIAGYYYLYNEEGTPIWYLFVATLEPSDEEGVKWVAEAPLRRAENGQCLGCEYQPPVGEETDIVLRVEFIYRTYARFNVNGGTYQFMAPLIYGISGSPAFEPYGEFVMPNMDGSHWVFAIQAAFSGSVITSSIYFSLRVSDGESVAVSYNIQKDGGFPISSGSTLEYGVLECYANESMGPICEVRYDGEDAPEFLEGMVFYVRPGNISDVRIFGEAESGWNIEGYRIGHD